MDKDEPSYFSEWPMPDYASDDMSMTGYEGFWQSNGPLSINPIISNQQIAPAPYLTNSSDSSKSITPIEPHSNSNSASAASPQDSAKMERRRVQNRASQRAWRERQTSAIKTSEARIMELEARLKQVDTLKGELENVKDQLNTCLTTVETVLVSVNWIRTVNINETEVDIEPKAVYGEK